MDREQSIELLNATHDFPCDFTLKVIGVAADDFVGRVVSTVREAVSAAEEPPFQLRRTPNGRHVSVTLTPTLESAEQVLSVYERIRTISGVVLTM